MKPHRIHNKKALTEEDIKAANSQTKSAKQAADYLGIAYNTYKKYAKKYGLFEEQKNPKGIGISTPYNVRKGKYALVDILDGRYPGYDPYKLKKRMIKNGFILEKCESCGLDDKRPSDQKVPLILCHKDGDEENLRMENLELLCYNCAFYHYGNSIFHRPKRHLFY